MSRKKQAKYNADIFKKRNNGQEHNGEDNISTNELAMIEYIEYKESVFKRFLDKIRSLFSRK